MIGFRHTDPRYPFLREHRHQPAARWHAEGEAPAHCFSDTPDGAWAEFLRHEEITDPEDLPGIRRALWAVDLGDEPPVFPDLPSEVLTGGPGTWRDCQEEARRLRVRGATGLTAPSAALLPGAARGWRVDGGLQPDPDRDGKVVVLFGSRPDLVGWAATVAGRPGEDIPHRVRHFGFRCVGRADTTAPLGNAEVAALTPEDVMALAREADREEAQAVVLSCTDMRAAEAAPAIEASLGKPVVTSNRAMMRGRPETHRHVAR